MEKYLTPPPSQWPELTKRPVIDAEDIDNTVSKIISEVRNKGDKALIDFAKKFDKATISSLPVTPAEFAAAEKAVDEDLKQAITIAAENIKKFHGQQRQEVLTVETMPGVTCWRKAVPIEKVGIYIPGGTAPLFSTVLMLAIPAQLAGCKAIRLCTPPDNTGNIHPAILYAAKISGITEVYKTGGAQAIAALAYGTESIDPVYKIFGPGNQYVTCAKQLVARAGVAIDMPAGPSEVAVIADKHCNPAFVASDLLSQAEHGADSQVMLVTNDDQLPEKVLKELKTQLAVLPREKMAAKSLENSKIVVLDTLQECIDFTNSYAPEHLIIQVEDPRPLLEKLTNAGSVFIGPYTPESAGDYASGTNHTLPTNGHARAYSGLSLESFMKNITFQEITAKGLEVIGPVIEKMAGAERLDAHKNAVTLRLKSLKAS